MLAACLTSSLLSASPPSFHLLSPFFLVPYTHSPSSSPWLWSAWVLQWSGLFVPAGWEKKWTIKKNKKNCTYNHFDDIIVATHVIPTCSSSWVAPTAVSVYIHTLLLLLNSRVQLQAAAKEVVVKMLFFVQTRDQEHSCTSAHSPTSSIMWASSMMTLSFMVICAWF